MAEIHVLIVPNLRSSHEKAAMMIKSSLYDVIFLNLPRSLQSSISKRGETSFGELVEKLRPLLPEPANAWIYLFEPILKAIGEVKSEVCCYSEDFEEIAKNSVEIAILTLKANITGKVRPEEWLKPLKPLPLDSGAELIAHRAKGRCLCISDLSGWTIARRIKEYGHEVFLKCVEGLYLLKPLEALSVLLEKGKADHEIAERLIKEHVRFVNEFVLKSDNLDEAYFSWVKSLSKFRRLLRR